MDDSHVSALANRLRDDGADDIADELEDAAEHDEHDQDHDGVFVVGCWFCWKESQQPGLEWPFNGPLPVRKVEQ